MYLNVAVDKQFSRTS